MFDVIIIGGGPAGLTAALYASRRSLKTLVLTRDIGGQISKTSEVENYPGIDSISGVALSQNFKAQAEKFSAEISYEEVKEIKKETDHFTIKTINNSYQSKTVIAAFGKHPRELGAKGEETFKGRGVSYCATCDLPFFKNKKLAIVGGGCSAVESAIMATEIAEKVYLIHRGRSFTAEDCLVDRLRKTKKAEIILDTNVEEIKGDKVVSGIVLHDGREIEISGVIVEIGYVIDRTLIENLVDLDEKNQVITSNIGETSLSGFFAAGDLTETPYKQVVISAGEGAKAALAAFDFIQKMENKKGITGDWQKLK